MQGGDEVIGSSRAGWGQGADRNRGQANPFQEPARGTEKGRRNTNKEEVN